MILLYIGIGFVYLLLGRLSANYLVENDIALFIDEDTTKFLITVFFPIAILWYSAVVIADLFF